MCLSGSVNFLCSSFKNDLFVFFSQIVSSFRALNALTLLVHVGLFWCFHIHSTWTMTTASITCTYIYIYMYVVFLHTYTHRKPRFKVPVLWRLWHFWCLLGYFGVFIYIWSFHIYIYTHKGLVLKSHTKSVCQETSVCFDHTLWRDCYILILMGMALWCCLAHCFEGR